MDSLKAVLGDAGGDLIFPCIQDLMENGLQLSRMLPSDVVPNRQDVTQFLAAWCRSAGMDEDACREWLSDYAVTMLSSISKTSPSGIRHSTKSNVKYIYRAEINFTCGREGNQFRARCSDACPAYADMGIKLIEAEGEASNAPRGPSPNDTASLLPAGQVKQRFLEQFEAAMDLVRCELEKGANQREIVDILNQGGMKTRTGRKWTYPILCVEIKKLQDKRQTESPEG